jgi:hypothetical protein
VLGIEAVSVGEGSKRVHAKRSAATAQQVVDALIAEGIAAERLLAIGNGAAPDGVVRVALRVNSRAESDMIMAPVEAP